MSISFLSKDEGITLIEVLLGIVILGVISVSFLAFFANSITFTHQNEINAQASKLAAEAMEVLKAEFRLDWDYIDDIDNIESTTISSIYNKIVNTIDSSDEVDLRTVFELDIDIEEYDSEDIGSSKNARLITVNIKWNDGNDSTSLESLIMER